MKKKLINIFGNKEIINNDITNKITPPNINFDFDISINDFDFDISLTDIIKKQKPVIKILKKNGSSIRQKRNNRLF